MNPNQLKHFQAKLAYETDSWDTHAALEAGEAVIVVDGRSSEAYAREHIPGAISLPHGEISRASVAKLDKAQTYICYCDGIGCNASTKTAMKLLELGFTVKELMGGLDWWKRDGYATEGSEGKAGKPIICGC